MFNPADILKSLIDEAYRDVGPVQKDFGQMA